MLAIAERENPVCKWNQLHMENVQHLLQQPSTFRVYVAATQQTRLQK